MTAGWWQQQDLVLESKQQVASMQQQQQPQQQQPWHFDLRAEDASCVVSQLQDYCRPAAEVSDFTMDEKDTASSSTVAWSHRRVEDQPHGEPMFAARMLLRNPQLPAEGTEASPSSSRSLLQRFAVLCLLENAVRQRLEQFQQLQQRMQQQRLRCVEQQQRDKQQHRYRGRGRPSLHGASDSPAEHRTYTSSQSHSRSNSRAGSRRVQELPRSRRGGGKGMDDWGEGATVGEEQAEGESSDSEDSAGELAGTRGSLSLLLNRQGQTLPSNADAISIWHHRNRLQPVGRSTSKAKLRAAAAAAAAKAAAAAAAAAASSSSPAPAEGQGSGGGASRAATRAQQQLEQARAQEGAGRGGEAPTAADSDWGEALLRWQLQEARVKRRRRRGGETKTTLQQMHAKPECEKTAVAFPSPAAAAADLMTAGSQLRPGAAAVEGEEVLTHADEEYEAVRRRAAAVETRILRSFVWELRTALLAIPVPAGAVHALFHHCRPQRAQSAAPPASDEAAEAALLALLPGEIYPSRLLYATRNLLLACRRLRRQTTRQRRGQLQEQTQRHQEQQGVLQQGALQQAEQHQEPQDTQSRKTRGGVVEEKAEGFLQDRREAGCAEAGRRRSGSDRHLEPVVSSVPTLRSLLREVCTAVSASMPPVLAALTPAECLLRFINSGSVSGAANRRLQTALASSTATAGSSAVHKLPPGRSSGGAQSAVSTARWRQPGFPAIAAEEQGEQDNASSTERLQTTDNNNRQIGRRRHGHPEDAAVGAVADEPRVRTAGKHTSGACGAEASVVCAPGIGGVSSVFITGDEAAAAGRATASLPTSEDGGGTDTKASAVCTPAMKSAERSAVTAPLWAGERRQQESSKTEDFHLLVSIERAILQGLRLFVKAQQQHAREAGGSEQQHASQEQQQGRQEDSPDVARGRQQDIFNEQKPNGEAGGQQQQQHSREGLWACSSSAWGEGGEEKLLLGAGQEAVEKEVRTALLRNSCSNIIYFSSLLQHECLPPFCVFQVFLHLRREAEKQEQQQQLRRKTKWEGEEEEEEEQQQQQEQARRGGEKGQLQQEGVASKQRPPRPESQQLGREQEEQPPQRQQRQSHQRPVFVLQHRRSWAPEDDERLLQAVRYVGVQQKGAGKWMRVAGLLPGRSNNQCRARYLYLVVDRKRHGLFSPLEDVRLQLLVACYGRGCWGRIARHLRGRTEMKCRERYEHCIYEAVKTLPWTASEDALLRAAAPFFQSDWQEVQRVLCGRPAEQCRERFEALQSEEKAERQVLLFLSAGTTQADRRADYRSSVQARGPSLPPGTSQQQISAWTREHLLHLFRLFTPYRCFSATVDAAVQAAAAAASPTAAVSIAVSPPAAPLRRPGGLVLQRGKEEGSSVALSLAQFARYLKALQLVALAVQSPSAAASSPAPIVHASSSSSGRGTVTEAAEQLVRLDANFDCEVLRGEDADDPLRRLLASCDYLLSSVEKAAVLSCTAYRLLSVKLQEQLSSQMQEVDFRTAHPGFFGVVGESLRHCAYLEAQLPARREASVSRPAEEENEERPRRASETAMCDSAALPEAVLPDLRLSPSVTPAFLAPVLERLRLRNTSVCGNPVPARGDYAAGSQSNTENERLTNGIFCGGASAIQEDVLAAGERSLCSLPKGTRMPLRYLQQRALPPSLIEAARKVAAAEIRAWRLSASAQKRGSQGAQQEERSALASESLPGASDTSGDKVTDTRSTCPCVRQPYQQQQSSRVAGGWQAHSSRYVEASSDTQTQGQTICGKPSRNVAREAERWSGNDGRGRGAASSETQRERRRRLRTSAEVPERATAAENATKQPACQLASEATEVFGTDAASGSASDTLRRDRESVVASQPYPPSAPLAREVDAGVDTQEQRVTTRGKRRRPNQSSRNVDGGFTSRRRKEPCNLYRAGFAQDERQTPSEEREDRTGSILGAYVDEEDSGARTHPRLGGEKVARLSENIQAHTETERRVSENAKQITVAAEAEGEEGAHAEKSSQCASRLWTRTTPSGVKDRNRGQLVVREKDAANRGPLRHITSRCKSAQRQEPVAQGQVGELWNDGCSSTGKGGDVAGAGSEEASLADVRDSSASGSAKSDNVEDFCQRPDVSTDRSSENSTTRYIVRCVLEYHRNLPESERTVEEGLPVDHAGTALDLLLGQTVLGIPVIEKGSRFLKEERAWRMVKRALSTLKKGIHGGQ